MGWHVALNLYGARGAAFARFALYNNWRPPRRKPPNNKIPERDVEPIKQSAHAKASGCKNHQSNDDRIMQAIVK
jgi:hypothetical protein